MRRFLALALLATGGSPALAQGVVTSPAPDKVSISIYRAPDRASDTAMDLDWLEGYALVTEQRTVDIPAGKATIRFEGVAAGLFPESAIVTGTPQGVREKNLDADLLSPRSLYARMFGRPVTLRRTVPGSGAVREERAVIRSGPDGAAILQTASGFEVANCGGLQDEILYPQVPADLSARPTLSIETESDRPQKATLQLSYLAWGFDWQTNYVVRMNPDGRTAQLSAWVTLASSDSTSFMNADAAVIAGEVNREDTGRGEQPSGGELVLRCALSRLAPPPLPFAPPPPPVPMMMAEAADIVVTAQRREGAAMKAPVTVQEEGLGDLKLYRVPVAVTVAANAQKQVALAEKPGVKVETFYRADLWRESLQSLRQVLRTRNRKAEGLGLPLPGGPVAVFEPASTGQTLLLAGEGGLQDRAVGEDVEIEMAGATQVSAQASALGSDKSGETVRVDLTNARAIAVRYELRVTAGTNESVRALGGAKVMRKDGRWIMSGTLPPQSAQSVSYKIVNSG